jgi:oligopeptide transport system substrate-binding protein
MRGRFSKLHIVRLFVVLGAVAVILSGCANIFSGGTSSGGTTRPDSQQILRYPLNANSIDIKTMDPAENQDFYSYFPISLVFPGLLTLNASGQPVPWAATSMPSFNAANNTYTVTVRSGLKWSDGTPIDANTFAYSINRSLSPCTASPVTYYMFPIKDAQAFSTETCASNGTVGGKIASLIGDSVSVPNSQTLVITLNAPAPYFLQAICYPTAYAQPEQLIQKYGSKNWTAHLTDNGGFGGNLYKVSVWDHKGNLDLVRNASFWGITPKLREVDFKIYQTLSAEYSDYLIGRLDVGSAPPTEYRVSKARSDFHEVPYPLISYYQPNWARPPFNNLGVRQAFDLALNKTALAIQINQGTVTATNHIVPQGMYGYDPSLVGPDGTSNLTGNVAKASQLMQTYANANCGGQMSKCPPVALYDADVPSGMPADQAAVQMWQTAFPGYPITTQFVDFSPVISPIYNPNAPAIWSIGWEGDYPDPQDWLSLQFGTGAINNFGSVNVPAANALMTQADQDLGPDRMSLYNQAEQLLVTNVAWIPLSQGKTYYNVQPFVRNLQLDPSGLIPLTGPDSWETIDLT